jgi:hypothetical protein
VPNRALRLSIAAFLVVLGARWIVNHNPWSGPVVLELSATHAVHLNDWFTFVCWAGAALLVRPQLVRTTIPALLRRDRPR